MAYRRTGQGFRRAARAKCAFLAALAVGLVAGSATGQQDPSFVPDAPPFVAAYAPGALPALPEGSADAGSYLAARAADRANDFGAASEWFLRALADDPTNTDLLENCIAAMIGMAQHERAVPLAARLALTGADSQLAHMVLVADAAQRSDWAEVRAAIDRGQDVSQLLDGLARAWSHVGDGDSADAIALFDALIADHDTAQFGLYHKALALAVLGDLAGADAMFTAAPAQGLPYTRRSVIAHAQILSQLGEPQRALAELERFGVNVDPAVIAMRDALHGGRTLELAIVGTAAEGLAEGYYNVARLLQETAPQEYVLGFVRIAQHLHGDEAEYTMMAAGLLEDLGRYQLAIEAFGSVAADDPAFASAEFGRADVLRRMGAAEEAAEVLRAMLVEYPGMAMVHAELGDTLRLLDRMPEAREAYSGALALLPETDTRTWRVRFMRAVAAYNMGDWPAAEQDLRAAYALNPDNPTVLNFLGYSLVERGESLDEALLLISRAVAAEPENGAILDSYGWALFRLGRFEEAVAPLEHAVRLQPESAVINDHLGDVYWAVGRRLEAQFQWQRALSFETDPETLAAIRAKLAHGLEPEPETGEGGIEDL